MVLLRDQSLVRGVSWDSLHDSNNIYGNKVVEFNGVYYSVSLMGGCVSYHAINDTGRDNLSDWYKFFTSIVKPNELLEKFILTQSLATAFVVEKDNTLIDLNKLYTDYSWCQEVYGVCHTRRAVRGGDCVTHGGYVVSTNTQNTCGWRPILTKIDLK